MPSKDTIPFHLTKKTDEEIEKVRKIISDENDIPLDKISKKQAEIVFRFKAKNGKISQQKVQEILMGKLT